MARFIHTADWHLGKPFGWVKEAEVRGRLKEARLRAVQRIGAQVEEQRAELVLVAGDVFDSSTVTTLELNRGLADIGGLEVPVIVIPGNHDHGGQGSVYRRNDFEKRRADLAPNLRVVLEPGAIDVAGAKGEVGVRVLCCPLVRRHIAEDPTAWIRGSDGGSEGWGEGWGGPMVVLAHGSVVDFGRGAEEDPEAERSTPNLIDVKALEQAGVDYVALGDWHGQKRVGERSWYAGSPEPTRFGEDSGRALLVEVTGRGETPSVRELRTGEIGWHEEEIELSADEGLEQIGELERRLRERPGDHVLRIGLRGLLGLGARARLDRKLEELGSLVMSMAIDDQVRLRPSNAEIERLCRRAGLVGIAARNIEGKAAGQGAEAQVANLALLKLYATLLEEGEKRGAEPGEVRS